MLFIFHRKLFFLQSFVSQIVGYVYLKKEVIDQADFLHVDKYQDFLWKFDFLNEDKYKSFLQADTIISANHSQP